MKFTRRNSSLEIQKRAYLGDRSLSLDDLNCIEELSKDVAAKLLHPLNNAIIRQQHRKFD